jgi:hypothetical protein
MRIHRLLHSQDEPYPEVFTLRTLGQLSFRILENSSANRKTGPASSITGPARRSRRKWRNEHETALRCNARFAAALR